MRLPRVASKQNCKSPGVCPHCQEAALCHASPDHSNAAGLVGPRLTTLIAISRGLQRSFSTIRTFLREVVRVTTRGAMVKIIGKVSVGLGATPVCGNARGPPGSGETHIDEDQP